MVSRLTRALRFDWALVGSRSTGAGERQVVPACHEGARRVARVVGRRLASLAPRGPARSAAGPCRGIGAPAATPASWRPARRGTSQRSRRWASRDCASSAPPASSRSGPRQPSRSCPRARLLATGRSGRGAGRTRGRRIQICSGAFVNGSGELVNAVILTLDRAGVAAHDRPGRSPRTGRRIPARSAQALGRRRAFGPPTPNRGAPRSDRRSGGSQSKAATERVSEGSRVGRCPEWGSIGCYGPGDRSQADTIRMS